MPDAIVEQMRGKVTEARTRVKSQINVVRGRVVGDRKLLGDIKLFGGNSGVLEDVGPMLDSVRVRVQERTATITGMRPLERIGMGLSGGTNTKPETPLTQRTSEPTRQTKSSPVIGGKSHVGGETVTKPIIGGM